MYSNSECERKENRLIESLAHCVRANNIRPFLDKLRHGIDPRFRDNNGWSLLHHAMLHGSPEATIALLVDSYADLYEKSARYPSEDGRAASDLLAAFELEPGRIPRSQGGTSDDDGNDECIAMGSSDDRPSGFQNAVQELLNRIAWGCEPQPMTARQFVMLLFDECAHEMELAAIRHLHPLARSIYLLRFRRASEARKDAELVFQAASEGRPLELAKRLRLGVLAGGLNIKGCMQGALLLPLDAAQRGKHDECEKLLVQAEQDWKQDCRSKQRTGSEEDDDSDEDGFGFYALIPSDKFGSLVELA